MCTSQQVGILYSRIGSIGECICNMQCGVRNGFKPTATICFVKEKCLFIQVVSIQVNTLTNTPTHRHTYKHKLTHIFVLYLLINPFVFKRATFHLYWSALVLG